MKVIIINCEESESLDIAVYRQCEWIIRDIDRLRKLSELKRADTSSSNEVVFYTDDNGRLINEAVVDEAAYKCVCVAEALETIPSDMREGMIENIKDHKDYPDIPCVNTWKKWKHRFMYTLAKKLNLY